MIISPPHQPWLVVTTIHIHFNEGLQVRLPVSAPVLVSMLELLPGLKGVTFRDDLKFTVVQKDGRRVVMSTAHISLVDDRR